MSQKAYMRFLTKWFLTPINYKIITGLICLKKVHLDNNLCVYRY